MGGNAIINHQSRSYIRKVMDRFFLRSKTPKINRSTRLRESIYSVASHLLGYSREVPTLVRHVAERDRHIAWRSWGVLPITTNLLQGHPPLGWWLVFFGAALCRRRDRARSGYLGGSVEEEEGPAISPNLRFVWFFVLSGFARFPWLRRAPEGMGVG